MGRGHRGAAQDGASAARGGRLDVDTRPVEVDAAAGVAEAGAHVAHVARAEREGLLDARGRVVAGVEVVVAGGDRVAHPRGDRVADGLVERGRGRPAERHVGDRGPAVGRDVPGHPVDAPDHVAVGAAALCVEHAHGVDGGSLRDPPGGAGDRARDVGTVAVPVRRLATEGREALADAPREIGMALVEPRVDRVAVDPGARRAGLVLAVER